MGQSIGCVKVAESTVAIKEQCGKFDDVLEPGCHWVPWFIGTKIAGRLSLRIQKLDIHCKIRTKGDTYVSMVVSIQYRVLPEKAAYAFYKLSDPKSFMRTCMFRTKVPKLELEAAFERKNDFAKAFEIELEKAMSGYGYQIIKALIVDMKPTPTVKKAMNETNEAAIQRQAANDKAEVLKIFRVKKAEGEAESKYLAGLGIAKQRQAIVDGLRDSVLSFSENVPGTTAEDVMDMVMLTQYFDTMREIGASSGSSTVFIPHGPGAVRDIMDQLRTVFSSPVQRCNSSSSGSSSSNVDRFGFFSRIWCKFAGV